MSSLLHGFRRTAVVLGLLLTGVACPAAAQDAALDLVRSVAAECASARPMPGAKAQKRRGARVGQKRMPARTARAAGLPRLRLTAEQRGSGRVDAIDISDSPAGDSSLPAVERKGTGGIGRAFLLSRPR